MRTGRQRGFSILELMVVVAIVLILSVISFPKMMQIIDDAKIRANAQSYAGLLQTARSQATQDNKYYQVLTVTQGGGPIAFVDLNYDQTFDLPNASHNPPLLGDPADQLDNPIVVSDQNVPAGFDTATLLHVIPYSTSTSPMVDSNGNPSPGLAFNDRGLPCQVVTAGAACVSFVGTRAVAWVTYLQYKLRSGSFAYAAVTVTPAGRIKSWIYQNDGHGGGYWH